MKKCETGRKNWPNIVKKLKQQITVTSKHQFKSKMADTSHENIEFQVE